METAGKMCERHSSSLLAEMERVKRLRTLTPEARKVEVRRQIYSQLKAMEMERRQRVALEAEEECRRETEERERRNEERRRQEAKEREEEEKRANEQKALEEAKKQQLKQERLQWQKVMLVEQPLKRPRYTIGALKEEQQRRREELELCSVPEVGAKPKLPTSNKKAEQQGRRKTLHNNWVGEQKTDREPVKEKLHPNSSIYDLFAAKQGPEPEEKAKAAKPSGSLHWLQERLKVGFWVDKYQDHKEKKKEKRRLKAEEQYEKWKAFKNSYANYASRLTQQSDCYTDGSANRNSILKSIF